MKIGPKPKVLEIAKEVRPTLNLERIKALTTKFNTDIAASKTKEYLAASRYTFRGIVVAAMQALFEDGANRYFVYRQLDSAAQEGWALFLQEHPEIAEKIKASHPKKPALMVVPNPDENEDDPQFEFEGTDGGEIENEEVEDDDASDS